MTECKQSRFEFTAHFSRAVVADFQGGTLTSDGGALLLRQTDRRIGLLGRLAACFTDFRRPERCEHPVEEMVAQRVYGLALGYEELNDHDQLRQDPLLGVLAGKREISEPLASKSTLCRMERTPEAGAAGERYCKVRYDGGAMDRLLVDLFLESQRQPPAEIVLDLDATDTPLHGQQEERFFHGFYDAYCYLPLYVFCGDQLLGVRLRTANQDASAGSLEEIERIVAQIRARWPGVRITLRAEEWKPQQLYERLYCARGERENRIKEQMSLFADRMSAETMRANQLRLYLSAAAYVLVEALRRLGLQGTQMAQA